ncbi:leucine-rich repeat domain-containing protein [Flavobacterium sp. SUN046]|uniref:DUF7619 domain-containing protein n=1 Tax=Flavobacterium sp. SUN046 TaxID=3002440 RepID=UPI002DBE7D0F|nr:leucine-rich repeat domain-containing protein [Flavobacterium sp. SUN046]MEC4049446.1 leucine-rich repeat domain-containing protein [Flavobacterium sp. SUN046]
MKKSLHLKKNTAYKLVLFLLLFTSMAYAQPPIANPNPYYVCDDNNDGIGIFDLSTQITTILNGLNPNDYTLTFYSDSNYTTPITNPTAYAASNGAIIYIQVVENANVTNSATTTLQLQVNQPMLPTFNPLGPICSSDDLPQLPSASVDGIIGTWSPPIITSVGTTTYTFVPNPGQCATTNSMTISVYQSPTANTPPNLYQVNPSGVATFNLSTQDAIIIGDQTNVTVSYHETYNQAQLNSSPILTNYNNIDPTPQTIYARVTNFIEGCYSITSFQIIVTNPNYVYIPDTNFKTKLITLGIDTNSDGEIGYDEALVPTTLDVSYSQISDMTGIEYFTNLQSLYCNNNNISYPLNCTSLSNLNYLMCDYNHIPNLMISGITTLTTLFCTNNLLTSLDVSSATNLQNLQCDTNHLTTLNTTELVNLQHLSCYQNSLSSINVSGMSNLQSLDCRNNQITALNLSGLGNLQVLNCNSNQLTSLDVTQSPNLNQLACNNNLFTNLDLSTYTNLTYLACGNTQLSSIDVSNLVNLNIFYFYGSQQSTLNMDNLTNLTGFYCYNSNLTSIDVSHSTNLVFNNFTLSNNQSLTYLNMKNGVELGVPTINYCPNLLYVCAEEGILTSVGVAIFDITTTNNPTTQISSYCSFVPGGNYNTITGVLHFDSNNNGCDSSDTLPQEIKVNITANNNQGSTFSDNSGSYNFHTGTGTFLLTPEIENSNWFTFSPSSATVSFTNNNNNTNTQNFCITPNGSHQDVEIILVPISPARPGFNATYLITYRNKGNQILTMNNGIGFIYNANQMSFVSATTTPSSFVNGTISWDVTNLLPFESRSIYFAMNINSPLGTAPVAIGDILNYTATIALQSIDENMVDNTSILHQTVVGSYDPNSVTCIEGDSLPPSEIGNYLHYVINFENTGNYAAENVVVKDVIDTNLYDMDSLQLLSSSDPVYTRINGNKVEFIFENINLMAQGGNPPVGGHGNVLFKIKSKNTLQSGDFVTKNANIYFDYNAPVATNTSQTTYIALSNSIHQVDNSIAIYPNPTVALININCNANIKSIELYDVQGRILQTVLVNNANTKIDLSSQSEGIYFLKITSEKGSKVEKVVKQ